MLRRLILPMAFLQLFILDQDVLREALSTITSPAFCEFVLEVGGLTTYLSEHWDKWKETDKFLDERFAKLDNFRLIIRTSEHYHKGTFQMHAKEKFPLLAGKGRIRFETSDLIDKRMPLRSPSPLSTS